MNNIPSSEISVLSSPLSFRYATLKRSARDATLVLFTDERLEALEQSVSILDLNSDFFSVILYILTSPYSVL